MTAECLSTIRPRQHLVSVLCEEVDLMVERLLDCLCMMLVLHPWVSHDASHGTENRSGLAAPSVSCPARCYRMMRQKCDRLLSGVLSTQQSMSSSAAVILVER